MFDFLFKNHPSMFQPRLCMLKLFLFRRWAVGIETETNFEMITVYVSHTNK